MTTFTSAVLNQHARTENGMLAFKSTSSACVDLFFKIGAMRGKDVIPAFVAAFNENAEVAVRIALWARDAREGSGERKLFRDILAHLCDRDIELATRVATKVPELGRFDDLFSLKGEARSYGLQLIAKALEEGNGLAAKWMPRKGSEAVELRNFLGMSPKQYRKTLVNLTKVVESQMCAKDWDNINFNHVPSVASSRYKKAFARHTEKYKEWTNKLASGDKTVKVNAGALYPYDVLKGLINCYGYNSANYNKSNLDHVVAQWEALPNYIGESNVLAMADVSGSMTCPAGGYSSKSTVTCLDVSVSLALYVADKNKGKFKDTFLTFSGDPELVHLRGNIVDKAFQCATSRWAMNTNLHKAFEKILNVAVSNSVPTNEMPEVLLILSDMQFDACTRHDDTAMRMIERKYAEAGYNVPRIVFWNLNARDNVPVKFDKNGTALVSGFSPSICKSVLAADLENYTPENVMLKTISSERYDF